MNSYGKQIVANVMSSTLTVWDGVSETDLIEQGETLPSSEIELSIINENIEKGAIEIRYNNQNVFFELNTLFDIEKIIIQVNIDNEPECLIIYNDKIINAKRTRSLPKSYHLIKIKRL